MPLLYAGVSSAERRRRALAMLEIVCLADRGHHMPNQLSGGQQQRAAIARALINQPQIILADEPTGNLDSHTSDEILREFQKINQERGQTIIMVTHDPHIASYADRQIVVRDGLIESDSAAGTEFRRHEEEMEGVIPLKTSSPRKSLQSKAR